MSTYSYYGHDDGLVVTQPQAGKFVKRPMTEAELAAREPARKIAADIYRHANYAGVCYYEIWHTIAAAFERPVPETNRSDGYQDAFYQIAELLGMAAMPISPKEAFETVMLPRLRELVAGGRSGE